jgi:purine-binding chemotaxis protein CheW
MEHQFVIFELEGEYYGVPIAEVETIIKMQAVTRLPNMPGFLQGVTNLRGKVLPVVDLRSRFGMSCGAATDKTRIIVAALEAHHLGLVVDGVSEVMTVPAGAVEPPPSFTASVNASFITGIARVGSRLIILLDLFKVLREDEQEALPAAAAVAGALQNVPAAVLGAVSAAAAVSVGAASSQAAAAPA